MKAKCKWCGKPFTKIHNRQTYCTEHCRKEAEKEHNRNRQLRYYKKNRKIILQKRKGTATIGPRPNPDPNREHEIIRNEIDRLGIHIF